MAIIRAYRLLLLHSVFIEMQSYITLFSSSSLPWLAFANDEAMARVKNLQHNVMKRKISSL
jgi:hypothetical protein